MFMNGMMPRKKLDNLEEGDVAEDLKLKMLFDIIMVGTCKGVFCILSRM